MTLTEVAVGNGLMAQASQAAMGTIMVHKAFGQQAEEGLTAVCREVAQLEGLLSRFVPDSDISRVNAAAGIKSVKVRMETYDVLSEALEVAEWFPGCFDVTAGPLIALWARSKALAAPPNTARVQEVLPLVDYRNLILDPWDMTAGLRHTGQSIDLGGIGKGFTGDRILEVLKRYGITSAYSNLGGNVVTLGARPDGSPWRVGIQHPRHEHGLLGAVRVVNQTVVTSGDYQRSFTDGYGKRYHHILDPRTGYPAESGLVSVSIIGERSMAADALATAVFVAGMETGLKTLRNYPQTEAILVDSDLHVYATHGLRGRLQAERGIDVAFVE